MQKHVNLVGLVQSFPTNIFLQNLASIQKRTSPIKFAHLAEESDNGSVSNLSTKVSAKHVKLTALLEAAEKQMAEHASAQPSPGMRGSTMFTKYEGQGEAAQGIVGQVRLQFSSFVS